MPGYPGLILLAFSVASLIYLLLAVYAILKFNPEARIEVSQTPPITIFKPLCGLDYMLYENLKSFCQQTYPNFQIVFGMADKNDPAIEVVRRLQKEFPDTDIELVINNRVTGTNLKICNLANMYPKAKYDLLAIADSDMHVENDYLNRIASCFDDESVGAATCLYSATPAGGLASKLGAMFINEWFLPSVLVALTFQKLDFCFGATMVVRRHVLEEIGGFDRLKSLLADDHMLGKLVNKMGYNVILISCLVENLVHEPDFVTLYRHELRWARTIRLVQPAGYSLSFITYAIPLSLFLIVFWPTCHAGYVMVTCAIILRLVIHSMLRSRLKLKNTSFQMWLVPVRDCLNFIIWVASFFSRKVSWRQKDFAIRSNGSLRNIEK